MTRMNSRFRTSAGVWALAMVVVLVAAAHAQAIAGEPDAGFGPTGDGKVTTNLAPGMSDGADAVAVQPDGRIVAAGYVEAEAGGDPKHEFAVARYLPNGELDHSFDADGVQTTTFDPLIPHALARDVAIQGDGKIVVVGEANVAFAGRQFAVARYLPDGSLDTGFANAGKWTSGFDNGARNDGAAAVTLDGTDIVVAGTSDQGAGGEEFAIARLHAEGTLDPDFGTGGRVTTGADSSGLSDVAGDVAVDLNDGKIVAVGQTELAPGVHALAVHRYESDGTLDDGFNSDGIQKTQVGLVAEAEAVAIEPNGRIVVAGDVHQPISQEDWLVARYLPENGDLDPDFSGDGIVLEDVEDNSSDFAADLALQPDGKIIVAGRTSESGVGDAVIGRFTAGGERDGEFAGGGILVSPLGPGNDGATAVALDSDGRIVTSGYAVTGGETSFALARFLSDPPPPADPTPGGVPAPHDEQPDDEAPADEPPGDATPADCGNLIRGTAGGDELVGTDDGDRLVALGGADRLEGAGGADCLAGGRGGDSLMGGDGDDRLAGGSGRNSYRAGPGNDRITAANGLAETLRCGPGRDRVRADREDTPRGCERVKVARGGQR